MPVDLQSLQSFVGITNVDRFTISDDNTLGKRNAVSAFFHRIGDAFRRLSQSGRAAIAERNDRILAAMEKAVNEARAHEQPEIRTIGERLITATANLRYAASRSSSAVLADRLNQLRADRGFQRLPEMSQRALVDGFRKLAENLPFADWQRSMDMLRADFLQPAAERIIPGGPEDFKTQLVDAFKRPAQQNEVQENGMHISFLKDAARRSIEAFNGQPLPADIQGPPACAAYSEARLRELVGEEHERFLPFISMMISQAGINSAPIFLPTALGLSDEGDGHLMRAGLNSVNLDSKMSVDREGDDLIIRARFRGDYINVDSDIPGAVLSREGTVSLRIHLQYPPYAPVVTLPETSAYPERDIVVWIPDFDVENAEVRYTVPNNGAAVVP